MSSMPREALKTRASKPGRDGGAQLEAQRLGAGDHLLRIRDVGRGDLVQHVGGRVAEHALGADVEDLDDALLVGGDAGEVGAVEDGVLQGAGLEQRLLGALAGRVVGADEQVADDCRLVVAQRGDRDDRGEAAAVLADVGQLVDVFDAARGLEDQRLEARADGGPQLDAQRSGARDQFLRIGDVGGGDLVEDVDGGVPEHALGADVEELDDALLIGGDAGEVGAVEDGVLQGAGLEEGFLPEDLRQAFGGPGRAFAVRFTRRGRDRRRRAQNAAPSPRRSRGAHTRRSPKSVKPPPTPSWKVKCRPKMKLYPTAAPRPQAQGRVSTPSEREKR